MTPRGYGPVVVERSEKFIGLPVIVIYMLIVTYIDLYVNCHLPTAMQTIPSGIIRVVHGTYLSVPFPSHSNLCLSHPIPSHGTFTIGFP